jgi:hypothetical protein
MTHISRRGVMAATLGVAGSALIGSNAFAEEEAPRSTDEKSKLRAATKKWLHFGPFATLDAVVQFVNLPPAQGAGEVVVVPRTDGKFDVLIYL